MVPTCECSGVPKHSPLVDILNYRILVLWFRILACRNAQKAEQAAKDITEAIQSSPNAGKVEVGQLDLSDLDLVKKFAEGFIASLALYCGRRRSSSDTSN